MLLELYTTRRTNGNIVAQLINSKAYVIVSRMTICSNLKQTYVPRIDSKRLQILLAHGVEVFCSNSCSILGWNPFRYQPFDVVLPKIMT